MTQKDDLTKVRSLAIGETSFKCEYRYVTVVNDAEKHRTIDI